MHVFYTRIVAHLPVNRYEALLSLLPKEMQQKNRRFLQWTDRQLHLAGKLLLLEALQRFGFNSQCLRQLRYNAYNRPFINEHIDFNISHSGNYVLCAIGQQLKVGIDIEEIRPVNFSDFENVMTSAEWESINHSPDPLKCFYKYWTIKESVIKADSRGLGIPLTDIQIQPGFAQLDAQTWHLQELLIDDHYCASVATDSICENIHVTYLKPYVTSVPLF